MSDESSMSVSEQKKEDWMNSKWRPAMGWMYMLVCTMDFVVFPILWSLIQVAGGGKVETQWSPLTLQGAGLFHMAMGAVLGLAAFGRTQEKIAGVNNGGATQSTGFGLPTTAPTTSGGFINTGPTSTISTSTGSFGGTFNQPSAGSVSGNSGFGTPATPAVTSKGKLVVPTGPDPEL